MRLILLLFAMVFSCGKEKPADRLMDAPVMPPSQLNVAFLVVDGVYNSELIAPMDVFHHTVFHTTKGMRVFTVAEQHDTITTFEGLNLIPDYAFSTDSIPKIDVLVVPSAEHSMDTDLENERLIKFVRSRGQEASYVLSLCDGAFVLARAGLLDHYECTTFPSDIHRFREMFPQLRVHEGVSFVHDRKAVTSAGGALSYEPALYLVELLYGKHAAVGIGKGLVIEWDLATVSFIATRH